MHPASLSGSKEASPQNKVNELKSYELPDVPRYSLPSVSSILPVYSNAEQDFIRRAFTNANYDMLCSLPDTIRANEVTRRRTEIIHATLSKHIINDSGKSLNKATTNLGLFSEFEYQQDPYDNMDKLFRDEQEASMAMRAKVRLYAIIL